MNSEVMAVMVKGGTIIHIGGIPFRLMFDTVIQGHQKNIEMVTVDPAAQDPAEFYRRLVEEASRPWWQRLLIGIRNGRSIR